MASSASSYLHSECQWCKCPRPSTGTKPQTTPRQKIDHILDFAEVQYSWSLSQVVEAIFTAPPDRSSGSKKHSAAVRTKRAATQLAREKSTVEAIVKVFLMEQSTTVLETISKEMRREQAELRAQVPEFGPWNELQSPDQIFNLIRAVEIIEKSAPLMYGLLQRLSRNQRERGDESNFKQDKAHCIPIFFILGILNNLAARDSGNCLQKLMGLYFRSNIGRKRMVIVLSKIGLIESWTSLAKTEEKIVERAKVLLRQVGEQNLRIVIVWDNFEVYVRVSMPGIGQSNKLFSLTTGKVFTGLRIPETGLKSSMFKEDAEVHTGAYLNMPGLQHDYTLKGLNVHMEISRAYIARALYEVFPNEIRSSFDWAPDKQSLWAHAKWPKIPDFSRMAPQVTHQTTLELMMHSEGTISGTHKIIDDIFLQQLGRHHEVDFNEEEAYIVVGDQMTLKNILGVKNESAGNPSGYGNKACLIPVPGCLHLGMHVAMGIIDVFEGPPNCLDTSALSLHQRILGRSMVDVNQAPYTQKKRLIHDSGYARIVAFALNFLAEDKGESVVDSNNWPDARRRIRSLGIDGFLGLVDRLYNHLFSLEAQRSPPDVLGVPGATSSRTKKSKKARTKDPIEAEAELELGRGDEEIINHKRYLFWSSTYWALEYAIKWADVKIIKWVVHRLLVLFHAKSKRNYAFISAWLVRILETSACDKVLQEAILANMLVNLKGRCDSWFPVDLLNELLNKHMRDIAEVKRTGSFDIDSHLQKASLLADFQGELRTAVEDFCGFQVNTEHTEKNQAPVLFTLAYKIAVGSVRIKPLGLPKPIEFPDLVAIGIQNWITKGADRFRAKVVHRKGMFDRYRSDRAGLEDDEDDLEDTLDPAALLEEGGEPGRATLSTIDFATAQGFGLVSIQDGGWDPILLDEGYASQVSQAIDS